MACRPSTTRKILCAVLPLVVLYLYWMQAKIDRSRRLHQNEISKKEMSRYPRQSVIGPGERAAAVVFSRKDLGEPQGTRYEELFNQYEINVVASDMISVHRSLPEDVPDDDCKALRYPADLPAASVIIPFRDEVRTVLLRTIHSVLERSPSRLLAEVILVDDGSVNDDLRGSLEVYFRYLPKVQLVRLNSSVGLMMARQTGIDMAKSEIIVVMDSHCEAGPDWLEPLLARIASNPQVLVFPATQSISATTFEYQQVKSRDISYMASFDFYFQQIFMPIPQNIRTGPIDPIRAISIQGSTFAMRKDYFLQLGGFDPGMKLWGAEQHELSIKVGMCDGQVEMIPCSSVGHVYRRQVVWGRIGAWETAEYNIRRLAAVWLDDFAPAVFAAVGNTTDYGDVSDRLAIRRRNNCRNFSDYIADIQALYGIYVPANLLAQGTIRHVPSGKCVDGRQIEFDTTHLQVVLSDCTWRGHGQYWEWSADYEIRHAVLCWAKIGTNQLTVNRCNDKQREQWRYTETGQLIHQATGMCADVDGDVLLLRECGERETQKWHMTRLKVIP